MYLLAGILIGLIVGWGTGRLLKGHGYGPLMDLAMGVGGAISGGFAMRSANIQGVGGTAATTLAAAIGAAILVLVVGLANGRRLHLSQVKSSDD